MQTFRRGMPVVIIFLIVMFVGLFIYEWGYVRTGTGNQGPVSSTGVAKVNGEELSLVEYDQQVKDAIEQRRQQGQDAPVDEDQIREQVYQQMVNEALIRQAAKRFGVEVSDDQVRETMLFDPPAMLKGSFTDSTGFNAEQYLAFITDVRGFLTKMNVQRPDNQKMSPAEMDKIVNQIVQIEKSVRLQKMVEGVQAIVSVSAIPSPIEARLAYNDEHTKVSGGFVVIDPQSIPDSAVKVSDDEARKYYDEHRSDYQQKASRQAKFVIMPLQPSGLDSSSMAKRLQQVTEGLAAATTPEQKSKAFQDFLEKFKSAKFDGSSYTPLQELSPELQGALTGAEVGTIVGPIRLMDGTYMVNVVDVKDSGDAVVKASHILFRTDPSGKNDDSIKAEATKVLAMAKGGQDFATLAAKYSTDPGSAQKGGDVGYVSKTTQFVQEFKDAALVMQPGQISGLVKSQFGYHIIKVTERSTRSYKLRDMRFDPKVSPLTKTALKTRAQQFRDSVANGANIDTIAARMHMQVQETGPIDRATPTAGSSRFTRFIADGKTGDVTDVYELKDGAQLVGQITKVLNAGVQDFAEAKTEIVNRLRMRKKLDMLKARAEKMFASLAPGDSLSKLTSLDSSLQVRTFNDATVATPFAGVGFDYPLTAAVLALKPGQRTNLIRGDHGYYIAAVTARTDPADADYQKEKKKFVDGLIQQHRQQMFNDWLQKEHERADIVDLRNGR